MVDFRTAIDLKHSQLLASVKGYASRPNRRPTLDPVSALAEGLVEWLSEKCCSVQHMLDYSHYDWCSLGYVYPPPNAILPVRVFALAIFLTITAFHYSCPQ